MLFNLLTSLIDQYSFLNVFKYLTFRTGLSVVTSLIVVFIIVGMFVIYNFKDHNQKRAIDACIAGSQKLEKPMTVPEAKIFCEEQIKNNK